jgi:hypothetical protein
VLHQPFIAQFIAKLRERSFNIVAIETSNLEKEDIFIIRKTFP